MRRPIKWIRMLGILVDRGARGLNTFEAAHYGDHCWPQTVDKIQRNTGIRVERKLEAVPGWCGTTAHCARYWLSSDACKRALEFLSGAAS